MIKGGDLNSLIQFKTDLEPLVREIQSLQTGIYSDKPLSSSSSKAILLKKYLEDNDIPANNISGVEEALKNLKEDLLNLEILTVKVSRSDFPPEFWDKLFHWLKNNMTKQPYLLDREVDPYIFGGLVISWRGTYLDLSLKEKLEAFFAQEEEYVLG